MRVTVHIALRTVGCLVTAAFWLAPGLVFAQPPRQDEFVPVSELPPQDQLQPVAVADGTDEVVRGLAETFNANVEKLNARMFTHMDYAVIAEKG